MCVRACVRVFNCVSCSRDKGVRARRGFCRERERERGLDGRFSFFYLFFVSCLVLSSFLRTLPLINVKTGEKDELSHRKFRLAWGRLERKKQSRRKKRQSVRAEPSPRPTSSGPQQHGSSCRRNLHLRFLKYTSESVCERVLVCCGLVRTCINQHQNKSFNCCGW